VTPPPSEWPSFDALAHDAQVEAAARERRRRSEAGQVDRDGAKLGREQRHEP
jgi:hypothetical protein